MIRPKTYTIEWHEQCQQNMGHAISRAERDLLAAQRDLARLKADYEFRGKQIAEAKSRGLTRFDSHKLLVKTKKS
jgi:hypothetical protein